MLFHLLIILLDDAVITWKRKIKSANDDEVIFFGDSSLINDESERKRISRTHNNSLVIKNARIEDTGIYVCDLNVAGNGNYPTNVTYIVTVSENEQTLKIFPDKSVIINEKEDLKLSCSTVSGEDPVSLIWSHGVSFLNFSNIISFILTFFLVILSNFNLRFF